MDAPDYLIAKNLQGQASVGAALGGLAQANLKRPETALEATITRMSAILSRVHGNAQRAETAANAVLGYEGEKVHGGAPQTADAPISVVDYLNEIDAALDRLEYGLGRLT